MNNIFNLSIIICLLTVLNLEAQQDNYTYLTDKKFDKAEDLFGYTFVPGLMEIAEPGQTSAGEQTEISAGSYKFGIARGNLFVKGEGINGVHNINQINTTEFGFQLVLMNARDPKQQGHLKIFKLKSYVDALVFKASNDAQEMIFLLPEISESLMTSEKKYFTDRNEIFVEFEEDIWGSEIFPFFKTVMPKRVYQRVQKEDNVMITFIETERIIEKGKKKKDNLVLAVTDQTIEDLEAEETTEDLASTSNIEEETAVAEVEIEEDEDDDMPSYFKVKKKEAPRKTVPENVYEEQEVMEEVDVSEGLFADEGVPEKEQNNLEEERKGKKDRSADRKVKIVTEYKIEINDFVLNDDGSHEPIERTLIVKDYKMRQDDTASNPNEVYQIEFETNKGSVYIYLNESKKITKLDLGEIVYLMRGL